MAMFGHKIAPVGDLTTEVYELKKKLARLEDDVLLLRGNKIRPGASTVNITNAGGGGGGGLTQAQVIALVQDLLIFQEDISSVGTSHNTSYAIALDVVGNPIALPFLNGVEMRLGSTGSNGWSFSGTTGVTTVRTLAASDKLTIAYVRRTA